MATYAVGDIQGCLKPLQSLLIKTNFDPSKDKLWVVGDMVNRGPHSLETLRLLYHLRNSLKVVLGNHDLHLLAAAVGKRKPSPSDTLTPILEAPDRDILLEWVRQQPLLHHDAGLGYTLVHAGIPPQWSLKQALSCADEVHEALRGKKVTKFLGLMYGNQPDCWSEELTGYERWRLITNYFTRMRFCTEHGKLEFDSKTGINQAPEGYQPWFSHSNRKMTNDRIVFGHWAALEGQADHPNVFALDTGCVWGGELTMMRLEDQKHFSVSSEV